MTDSTLVPVAASTPPSVTGATYSDDALAYAEAAKADSTWNGYRGDWRIWAAWCAKKGVPAMPGSPAAICEFVVAEAARGMKVATIERRLAAIGALHQAGGHESPATARQVRLVMGGVRRRHGTAQRKVRPVTLPVLAKLVAACPEDARGRRDAAILLVGWAGALRRSEVAALTVEDVTTEEQGIRLLVRRSKTDQEGAGYVIGVPRGTSDGLCPVAALEAWMEDRNDTVEAMFQQVHRSGSVQPAGLSGRRWRGWSNGPAPGPASTPPTTPATACGRG